ncbi:CMRF35-like molecule 8 [Engraulis encrasicolus]|uniref:CMRF35-like molecule 8 n=1 Tax=Engraulis encrasicolus TaxID=184585 RepID=UPI002FD34016
MHPTIPTLSILSVLSCVASDNIDTVTGYVGHTADIKCPYGEAHKAKSKYLQKGLDTTDNSKSSNSITSGSKLVESVEDEEWTHRGRVSLQDQKNFNTFTVTIHNLTLQDAGVYACGVQGMFGDISILTVIVKIAQRLA